MNRWHRLGRVFVPQGETRWLQSHASVPVAEHIDRGIYRIYFSSRDQENRSHTGALVIDIEDPTTVLDLELQPVLSPGDLGCFDDSGAMATWLTQSGNDRYLYFIGWNLGVTVPFRNSIGLAVSHAGGPFRRIGNGPILDRTVQEPHFVASCAVTEKDGAWDMWYLSCVGWAHELGLPQHRYHIKHATSTDGIGWSRAGTVAIDFKSENETCISRPSVMRDNNLWRMWYSYRENSYQIGYAESSDGMSWVRQDEQVVFDSPPGAWESEMIEYPFVFEHDGTSFMLYNGNGFGRTGFGIAVESTAR